MLAALMRFFVVLILFIAVGTIISLPPAVSAALGIVFGLLTAILGWYSAKTKQYTAKQLGSKPFDGKLPVELGKATETAVALAGDDSYSQKIVGESFYAANFEDLRKYAQLEDGEMLEVQSALVAEPANPHSKHAVAVTCGGVVLGHIAEFESESLFTFLMQNRGMARVNSNIYFSIADGMSYVELDLVRPYKIVKGV